MNLTSNGTTRTVLWVEGFVERNTSGTIIDPGTPVGNIEQAIGNANAAASAANAAAETATQAASAAQNVADNVEGEVDDFKRDLVLVQSTQPTSDDNRLWIKDPVTETDVPTYNEFNDLKSALQADETAMGKTNIYTPGDVITPTTNEGWYISGTVQLNSQNNTNFKVSTVPVTGGTTYRIQGTTRLQAVYPLVAFATTSAMSVGAQGTLVIEGATTNTEYDEYYTPENDGYLWIASYSTREILSVTPCTVTTEYKNIPKRRTLKMQLFGDSITDNTWGDFSTWANYINEYMPMYDVTVVNSAVGGSRLSKSTTTTDAVQNLVEDGTTVISDADLIIIWAGTNDWASGGPELGTFLGNYGIYGAVKSIINTLSTNVPSTMILFVTPMQRYNSTDQGRETDENGAPVNIRNNTLEQFSDAIKETCEFYGIPCLDMYGGSGFNRINLATFTSDGLHPNTLGDKRIAHRICKTIDLLFGYAQ